MIGLSNTWFTCFNHLCLAVSFPAFTYLSTFACSYRTHLFTYSSVTLGSMRMVRRPSLDGCRGFSARPGDLHLLDLGGFARRGCAALASACAPKIVHTALVWRRRLGWESPLLKKPEIDWLVNKMESIVNVSLDGSIVPLSWMLHDVTILVPFSIFH